LVPDSEGVTVETGGTWDQIVIFYWGGGLYNVSNTNIFSAELARELGKLLKESSHLLFVWYFKDDRYKVSLDERVA
jgi:hypothetical protein